MLIRFTQECLDASEGRYPARSQDPRPRPRTIRVFEGKFLHAISYAPPSLPGILWGPPMLYGIWVGHTGKAAIYPNTLTAVVVSEVSKETSLKVASGYQWL